MLNLEKDTYILEFNYSQYQLNDNIIPRVDFCVLADYGNNKESIYLETDNIVDLIKVLESTKTTKKILVRDLRKQAGKMLLNTLIDLGKKFIDKEIISQELKELKKQEPDKKKRKQIRYNYKDNDLTVLNYGNNISEIKYYFGNGDGDTSKKKELTRIIFIGVDTAVNYNFSDKVIQPLTNETDKVSEEAKQETFERLINFTKTLDFNKTIAGKHWAKSISTQVSKQWQETQDNVLNTFFQLTLKNKVFLDWQQYSDVRHAYKGGLVYAKDNMMERDFKGISLDINSAFGEAMLKAEMPWNHCFEYDKNTAGNHFTDNCDCFSILEIQLITKTVIKNKCIPFLIKNENDPFEKKAFDIKAPISLEIGTKLTYTKDEIELAKKTYNNFNFVVNKKFCFDKTKGIFDEIVDKLYAMRKKDDPIADKYAKICIVNLYSLFARSIYFTETKFSTNGDLEMELTNKCFGSQAEVVIKEVEKTLNQQRKLTSTSYFPIATAISSYVRIKLIKAVNLNYDKVHYANTDGILMETKEIPEFVLEKGDISQTEIGKWKIDAVFEKARILGINQWCSWNKVNGTWKVEKSAISGLDKEQQLRVMPDMYQYNKVLGRFKHYKNEYVGYVLYDMDFAVKRVESADTKQGIVKFYEKRDQARKEFYQEKKEIANAKFKTAGEQLIEEMKFDSMEKESVSYEEWQASEENKEKNRKWILSKLMSIKNEELENNEEIEASKDDIIEFDNLEQWKEFMDLDDDLKPKIEVKERAKEEQQRIWGLEYYNGKNDNETDE